MGEDGRAGSKRWAARLEGTHLREPVWEPVWRVPVDGFKFWREPVCGVGLKRKRKEKNTFCGVPEKKKRQIQRGPFWGAFGGSSPGSRSRPGRRGRRRSGGQRRPRSSRFLRSPLAKKETSRWVDRHLQVFSQGFPDFPPFVSGTVAFLSWPASSRRIQQASLVRVPCPISSGHQLCVT